MPTNSIAFSRLLMAERKSLLRQVRRLVGKVGAEDIAQKLWLCEAILASDFDFAGRLIIQQVKSTRSRYHPSDPFRRPS